MNIYLAEQPERRIAIISKQYALIIKPIKIDHNVTKPSCAIELVRKESLTNQGFTRLTSSEISGFIGLIEIDKLIFIGTISGSTKVAAPIPGETVKKISSVDFFCLNDPTWDFFDIDSNGYPILPDRDTNDIQATLPKHPCAEIRKLLSNGSFFYSSDFDLTSTLQNRGVGAHSLSTDNFEQEYMWNSFMMGEIITYKDRLDNEAKQILDDEGFLTTVIRGFAETFVTHVKSVKVATTIISKQSWKRAGTRFNARGVDDDANVANFVETEYIMYCSNYCYAFTEIRGSIPVFWEQDTSLINPKVQITRSMEATQPIFDDHFEKLIKRYGPVHVVNLLSTKSSEIELSRRYYDQIKQSKKLKLNSDILYTAFDFHKETAQEGFSAVSRVIPLILDSLLISGYFAYDCKAKKIMSEQHGIFRTNCLDCLDRTNLVQQVISYTAFKTFLEDFHFISKNDFVEESDFTLKHNALWADHGDMVSQIYTGTNALKSSFSRKGKMSFAGALSDATKSVSRMYINNFMDKGKQQNIDMLLGRLPNQQAVQLHDPINEYVTSELENQKATYVSRSNINVLLGTYNVNGATRKVDLSKWLFPIGDKFKPDVVILGLQEVIELTAGSILNADYSKGSFWENMVSECLNQYSDKYLLLRVEQMSSLIILFFVKSDKASHIKRVEGATKKTGFGGMTGNKGAVAIRFEYDSTSFCFINTHLSAGVMNVEDRKSDYESIQNGIIFSRSRTIPQHDSIFWLGDTNYRINLTNEEVRKELNLKDDGYIDRLLNYDQLTLEMKAGTVFKGFREPSLKFRPTYKYDNGTDTYDSSEKARTPSWTDRIIYNGSNLQPLAYSDAPLLLSDHRPVFAAYRAGVLTIDEPKKIELTKKLYNAYKTSHPNEVSSLNAQLVNLGLEGEEFMERTKPPTVPSDVSLLDMAMKNEPSRSSSTSTSGVSSPTGSLSRSNSQISAPLQPKRAASNTIMQSGSNNSSRVTSTTSLKPVLRPPPPPAYVKPVLPVRPVAPVEQVQKEVANDTTPVPSMPAEPRKEASPPPGFSSSVLTPRNSSASPAPAIKKETSPTRSLSKPASSPQSPEPSSGSTTVTERVPSSTVTPHVNKSMSAWEPLTPK
ncbi:similar to Saccharomyces cerevisiae YOR109W INP53 Polyphosphatidylinositol phosphatase, dephosphorylates multiple phosphatidylinositols [Maudiozyma saulgeensis]|uniref:phosphoinositide 5-phosphatase n=1 Tax=Maudiozyma saulgeensis TaxID=1789683 RepID=A0A1X7R0G2_9SACH|nr:similar to Saccharomyces cerevisiae YOR109W INP53 Polyphosphatidylinositol phosphatase, dephosphorylates multiple phosphatidylinositols [Kazachstania saulgeensis]